MNGEKLYELLQELPDEFITEAAGPHHKRRIAWRVMIPAIAACFAVIIAAAVYPKIRIQKPDITADVSSAATEQTAVPVTQNPEALTTEPAAQTTASASAAQTTYTREAAAPAQTTQVTAQGTEAAAQPVTSPQTEVPKPQTTVTAAGTAPAVTTAEPNCIDEPVTGTTATAPPHFAEATTSASVNPGPGDKPEQIEIPVRMRIPVTPVSDDPSETHLPPNTTETRFSVVHGAEALTDADRDMLGSFDFSQQDVLFCDLRTSCAAIRINDAAVQDGLLTLYVFCADAPEIRPAFDARYAIGIPKSLGITQAQCMAKIQSAHGYFSNDFQPDEIFDSQPESITLTIYDQEESE